MNSGRKSSAFTRFAKWTAKATGHPGSFGLAVIVVAVWAISGPVFGFSDTWQLVINTGTTIVTFLMVFLIQSTQNSDTGALQVKLDEVIRSLEGAHNALLDLEEMDEKQLEAVRAKYRRLAAKAREHLGEGLLDTDCDDEAASPASGPKAGE